MDRLCIVIPAYNEEETIDAVAREWHQAVVSAGPESRLVIIDDGSRDSTYAKLDELQRELPQLTALTKPNSGHGGTLLFGYAYALEHGADYIFQTDSDGQTLPAEFEPFWQRRVDYDVQIGYRRHRRDGFSRVFVTKVLKLVLFLSFGLWITDANTPFRLMRRQALAPMMALVPPDYNLTNVMLTVLFQKSGMNMRFCDITFRPRQGGTNSINMKRIFKIGAKAISDFAALRKQVRKVKRAVK